MRATPFEQSLPDSLRLQEEEGAQNGKQGGHYKGAGWLNGHREKDAKEEFKRKVATALGKWESKEQKADGPLTEWPSEEDQIPVHYAQEAQE